MGSHFNVALALGLLFPALASTASPYRIPYETQRTYGYDGPWNAIKLSVGTPPQEVHLFPGCFWGIMILNETVCSGFDNCPAKDDVYVRSKSKSWIKTLDSDSLAPDFVQHDYVKSENWLFDSLRVGDGEDAFETKTASMALTRYSYEVFPNGMKAPPVLGRLSLGAMDDTQVVIGERGAILINELEIRGRTPSRTFGLHVGAAGVGQEGSLVFGGYEKGRVAREAGKFPFVPQSVHFGAQITRATIRIMGSGRDRSKDKTLSDNKFIEKEGPVNVKLDNYYSYFYLPNDLCNSLASALPVKFDSSLGLYIWQKIPEEALYLEFTLTPLNDARAETTIRLPLPLIMLTMSAPIKNPPAKYFPCRPTSGDEMNTLGRAFFQGAYMAANWHTGTLWLAQAMGPGKKGVTAQGPMTGLKKDADRIESMGKEGDGLWEASWEGIWGGNAGSGEEIIEESKKNGNGPVKDMTPVQVKPTKPEGGSSSSNGGGSNSSDDDSTSSADDDVSSEDGSTDSKGGSSKGGSTKGGTSKGGKSSLGVTSNGGSRDIKGSGGSSISDFESDDNNDYNDGTAQSAKKGTTGTLTTGGVAGIAIGAAAVAGMIGIAIFFFACHRRRRPETLHSDFSGKLENAVTSPRSISSFGNDLKFNMGADAPPYTSPVHLRGGASPHGYAVLDSRGVSPRQQVFYPSIAEMPERQEVYEMSHVSIAEMPQEADVHEMGLSSPVMGAPHLRSPSSRTAPIQARRVSRGEVVEIGGRERDPKMVKKPL